jgi:hypothetical protein
MRSGHRLAIESGVWVYSLQIGKLIVKRLHFFVPCTQHKSAGHMDLEIKSPSLESCSCLSWQCPLSLPQRCNSKASGAVTSASAAPCFYSSVLAEQQF